MMLGFAFLTGLGLGPLLDMAIMINPSIIPSALMLTSVVFASFTGAALVAPSGQVIIDFPSLCHTIGRLWMVKWS